MSGFTFLRPEWLLAFVLVGLVGWAAWRRRAGLGGWEAAIDASLLSALDALGKVELARRPGQFLAACAVAALLCLALAGPSVPRREATGFRNLDGVIFVLDAAPEATSKPDWNALALAARIGAGALGSRPAGLVVYGGDAYVGTDMSSDLRELKQTILLVGHETIPDEGQRPERGLALALRMLDDAQILAGDVVLLSGGDGLERPGVRPAAHVIAARGSRLAVLSLGPPPATEALATAGGGARFAVDAPDALARFLAQDSRERLDALGIPLPVRTDLGRSLALAALLPAAFLLRRTAP